MVFYNTAILTSVTTYTKEASIVFLFFFFFVEYISPSMYKIMEYCCI